MPVFFLYLFKLSLSLALVYLFYRLLLRRLTFYNHNRWYLLGYSLLCFVIPFIDISSALEQTPQFEKGFAGMIPVIDRLATTKEEVPQPGHWNWWNVLFNVVVSGVAIMLLRLAIQVYSFSRMRGKAKLVSADKVKFYQVDKNIIPFSFGNSIFVNQSLHSVDELREIVRHEFVHVKQKHSIDIIFAELLCILNWFNPFAWLIRNAIRQNLEFIADNRVLSNGMNPKEYQYLLLKVMGNNQYSIVSPFNFSSLKNRIVMMNTMKTTRMHLTRFLFILPLLAVILLSFRSVRSKPDRPIEYERETTQSGIPTPSPSVQQMIERDTTKPLQKKVSTLSAAPVKEEVPASTEVNTPVKIRVGGSDTFPKPHIVVDGVDWPDNLDIDMINPEKIENVQVFKNTEALKKYGDKGKNGVIEVTTKKSANIRFRNGTLSGVLFFIDGKPSTREAVELLEPNKIKAINVLKDEKAEEKYGEKARGGVVEVITKTVTRVNYIEQRPYPVMDVRNVLVGKRPQEC